MSVRSRRRVLAAIGSGLALTGAAWLLRRRRPPAVVVDRPRLAPGVELHDVTFFSAALARQMQYRVLLPAAVRAPLPAVYLLHGGGGSFHEWSNDSGVAVQAADLVLVAPQGEYSYWVDAATRPQDRYQQYVVEDLVADVERRFPVIAARHSRAVAGVSMGGFGAVDLALRRPDRWAFAGGLSAAIDAARRPFSLRRLDQSRAFEQLFGPSGSAARHARDPFVLAGDADPAALPFLFLTCGRDEPLLGPNRDFAALLARRKIAHEFHEVPGGHQWTQWDAQLPALFAALRRHLGG